MFNDAEHQEKTLKPLSATKDSRRHLVSEQGMHVNDCEIATVDYLSPLSATEGTYSTILSEKEIHVNECEIVSEQEISGIKKLATGESLKQPFATKSTGRAMLGRNEIDDIETATVGQSQNEAWQTYRKGRITASNIYRVFTKVETIKKSDKNKDSDTRFQNLVDNLLGRSPPPENLPALEYGRKMKTVAKQKYIEWFKENHRVTSYRECGLFIDETKQYLGASPDLIVECSCCGKGVVEIKRPYSVVDESPTPGNLSYLIYSTGQVTLKLNIIILHKFKVK